MAKIDQMELPSGFRKPDGKNGQMEVPSGFGNQMEPTDGKKSRVRSRFFFNF
jgi:hypothetical protein